MFSLIWQVLLVADQEETYIEIINQYLARNVVIYFGDILSIVVFIL
jgi:hypothetical protein